MKQLRLLPAACAVWAATLLPATGGTAIIDGHNLPTVPSKVRASIALTGQYAAD